MQVKPVSLIFWPLKGNLRLIGYPDASYRNNSDKSSQRGQCIFLAEPRQGNQSHTYGSIIDYESSKIKRTTMSTTVAELYAFMKCYGTSQFLRGLWCDISGQTAEIHMRTDANNLVTTAATTHLPEQKETVHMIQMLRNEACSGGVDDLAHVKTEHMLADCFTKANAKSDNLEEAVSTGRLPYVDAHPPFRTLLQHKAYLVEWAYFNLGKKNGPVQTILDEDIEKEFQGLVGKNHRNPVYPTSLAIKEEWVEHIPKDRKIVFHRQTPAPNLIVPRARNLPSGIFLSQLKGSRKSVCQFTAAHKTTVEDLWNEAFAVSVPSWTGETHFYY